MRHQVITDVSQVTIDWLTEVLQRSQALESGSVVSFERIGGDSTNASNARLRLSYSPDSLGSLPECLFLKMCSPVHSSDGEGFGDSESLFYSRDYVELVNSPVPGCFDVHYCPDKHSYHILMRDYSDTHTPAWKTTLTAAHAERFASACASLHAHHDQAKHSVQSSLTSSEEWSLYFDHVIAGLTPLLSEVGNAGKPEWCDAIKSITESLPRLMRQRGTDSIGQTLLHGDLNPGNILVPNECDHRVLFIDRQPFEWSLTTWLGVADIAYASVLWWDTVHRRELEEVLLTKYWNQLIDLGVIGYSQEALYNDYRLCVAQCLFVPMEWCIKEVDRKGMKWVWFPQLEKTMAAIIDLNCRDLL